MATTARATFGDLSRVEGQAELVNGTIAPMPPTGDQPNRAGFAITRSLYDYEQRTGSGRAYTDNVAYRVTLPHRESFSPDASYYTGPRMGMKFLEGAPSFAAEVRSEYDFGAAAEAALRRKRADYFAAGTLVVWDVDLLSADVVRVYRATAPDAP